MAESKQKKAGIGCLVMLGIIFLIIIITINDSNDKKEKTSQIDTSSQIQTKPSYEIVDKVAHKNITISEAWNENDIVRTAYSKFVNLGKEAFQKPEIKAIFLNVSGKLTDQYGNENVERIVKLKMTKSAFQKFNWENLEYRPIYRQMINSCEIHWIHPAVKKNLNVDKLYLKQ